MRVARPNHVAVRANRARASRAFRTGGLGGIWFTVLGIAISSVIAAGCTRRYHRESADTEAQCLIESKGGYLDNGSIYAASDSRLFDPFSADRPPMPPDDPASHRLMHCIDGKKAFDWDVNGQTNQIASTGWLARLPRQDDGSIELNLREAVTIARSNSRDYQSNLETLYRSALGVSFERFRFDSQFFGSVESTQNLLGRDRGAASIQTLQSRASISKLSATGGEALVGFANTLVWDLWGPDTDVFTSTIDFTLVQPLLRFGGRARVLENLTQSERDLLANVRQMEQYRQGFYVELVTGRNGGEGPRLGGDVGQRGLGLIAGVPSGRSGSAEAGGYLGLLQDQQQILNQGANITALRDSLAQLEAAFKFNRVNNRLQVDQARQALLNAQSSLLSARAAYDTRVDSFKVTMGLPPDAPIVIRDDLLDRFVLIDPELTKLQNVMADELLIIRKGRDTPVREELVGSLERIQALRDTIVQRVQAAQTDLATLNTILPERRRQLQNVAKIVDRYSADVDSRVFDEQVLNKRIDYLKSQVPAIAEGFAELRQDRQALIEVIADAPEKEAWEQLNEHATLLSDLLLDLSLLQAEARLQGIVLLPLDIGPAEAIEYARANRLDWMNARANLVDDWRKIEFFANDLKSDLDLTIDGQARTKPDNVLDFRSDESRLRFGIRFDTPTARLAQRNRYRNALIDYQEAKRDYTLFEDQVTRSLRNTLRIVTLSQINLEVRRVAVQVAIAQVDIARLKLNPPSKPGKTSVASPTAARDLVSALTDLLDAQNDFLNVWVSNEVLRVLLDFEMGTMQLDPNGVWIDPGPIRGAQNEFQTTGEPTSDDAQPDGIPMTFAPDSDGSDLEQTTFGQIMLSSPDPARPAP